MIIDRSRLRELICATLLLATATALALSPDAYLPMLARAFMLQWAAGFAFVAAITAWRRRWWMTLSALFGAIIVLVQVHVPVLLASDAGTGPALRIAHMNVLQPNVRHAEVIRCALASDADVISVQEVSPEWAQALITGLGGAYPYQHIETRTNCYGIALFSRVPFSSVRTLVVQGSPFVEAVVRVGDRSVRMVAVHTSSPISYAYFQRRNAQLAALASNVADIDMPTVVVGDLNTVHWDHAYARFCTRSGLNPLAGTELRSWPSLGPFALIPLDHVLVSSDLASIALRTFKLPGSDHRGLLAELQLKAHAR